MTCVCNVIIFATWLTTRHVQIWKHTYQVVTNALSISVAAPIAEIAHKTPLMIKTGALTQRQILPQLPFGCIIQATRSNWRLGTFLDYPSFYTTESTGNFFVAHSRITMRGGRDGTKIDKHDPSVSNSAWSQEVWTRTCIELPGNWVPWISSNILRDEGTGTPYWRLRKRL